jgi:hypothetical protein
VLPCCSSDGIINGSVLVTKAMRLAVAPVTVIHLPLSRTLKPLWNSIFATVTSHTPKAETQKHHEKYPNKIIHIAALGALPGEAQGATA